MPHLIPMLISFWIYFCGWVLYQKTSHDLEIYRRWGGPRSLMVSVTRRFHVVLGLYILSMVVALGGLARVLWTAWRAA